MCIRDSPRGGPGRARVRREVLAPPWEHDVGDRAAVCRLESPLSLPAKLLLTRRSCCHQQRRRTAACARPMPGETRPGCRTPVSYTHLTLPTILRVSLSV